MFDYPKLIDITTDDGKPIHEWKTLVVEEDRLIIKYMSDPRGKLGFEFYALECVGYTCPRPSSINDHEWEILWKGSMSWDGLRHLWMGDKSTDNEHYLYCLNTMDAVRIFSALHDLEKEHCDIDAMLE